MLVLVYLLHVTGVCLSRTLLSFQDLGDIFDASKETIDNNIIANYHVSESSYLMPPLKAMYSFNGTKASSYISHKTFLTISNDTSVIVVSNGAQLNLSFVNVIKYGYSSNLMDASFYGVNAAINVQNGSRTFFDHLNVITHNGAANLYSYGNESYIYIKNSILYSSGPTAHGLYATEYGTIVGKNIVHYSGGNRCSSFAGDYPAGYIIISDSIAHTSGIGSPIFYGFGRITATNVLGYAENSPALISDHELTATLLDCDLTAGLLGGIVMANSMYRQSNVILSLINSRLTALGKTLPALWFGNVIATVYLYNTVIYTKSNILAIANYSQLTEEFNHYASYSDNPNMLPAIVTINVVKCSLKGDLVAYNGSSIEWIMSQYSIWTGGAYSMYGTSYISVFLDSTSTWTLTSNTTLQNITSTNYHLTNINSNGYSITYNSSSTANAWLNRKTISLRGGGKLMPATA